jgi:AraC-like DNA-binding protein
MSIVHINTDLRETHLRETYIIGTETREWLISPAICPALSSHGILLAGSTEAGPDFCFVRPAPRWHQLLVCTGGSGWVWLEEGWTRCAAGEAYLTPAGVCHGYFSDPSAPWELCWVQSAEAWLRRADKPALSPVDSGPLAAVLSGLYREAMNAADPALLPPWAFLVYSYARRMVRPDDGDVRLRRLWERVGADLASPWTMEALAAQIGVSGEHLRRLCHQHLGRSPMRHVTSLRMRSATVLLASESYTVEAVARLVGYDNPFAFSVAFKRHLGLSPSEYRQKAHGR